MPPLCEDGGADSVVSQTTGLKIWDNLELLSMVLDSKEKTKEDQLIADRWQSSLRLRGESRDVLNSVIGIERGGECERGQGR